jgi:hypothetical protein
MIARTFSYHAPTQAAATGATSPLRSQPEVAFTLNQDSTFLLNASVRFRDG